MSWPRNEISRTRENIDSDINKLLWKVAKLDVDMAHLHMRGRSYHEENRERNKVVRDIKRLQILKLSLNV